MSLIRWMSLGGTLSLALTSGSLAGGGGENMLLVVNANDENSIRIATAYQQLRNIPTQNILFINSISSNGMTSLVNSNDTSVTNTYLTPIANAIASRGLTDQIDYIATLGMPTTSYTPKYGGSNSPYSFNYRLMRLDEEMSGKTSMGLSTGQSQTSLAVNSNTAMHHSQVYSVYYGSQYNNVQYYMSGALGFTGQFGNTADQVIANLQYTASGDGTNPVGTIYFEENDNVRSDTREYQWEDVQDALTARGQAWIQERNVSGSTPKNRTDVKGVVIGAAEYATPNGSTYLPGSWADSLTSYGTKFNAYAQTKATALIASGAAGSSGTVEEPYAIASKFPNANIHVFLADGSTIGEAFHKSVVSPYHQLMVGDMLAQPDADLPTISLTSAPANGQSVSGTVAIAAGASLTGAKIATGIKEMRLLVDGKVVQTNTGANANFNLDTLSLTDGQHELRITAVNNAAAESQSDKVWNVNVNNKAQSVAATSGNLVAQDKQTLAVSVAANAGTGSAVSRIELRSLGRVMGQVNASSGSINLDSSKLAYGDNPIIPVAILADGKEVAGESINVKRNPTYLSGMKNYNGIKTPGVKVEYFQGKGAGTIAASNFTGAPTQTVQMDHSVIKSSAATGQDNWFEFKNQIHVHPASLNIDKLAARVTSSFEVKAGQQGEYGFMLFKTNDSARLSVDGQQVLAYDNYHWAASNMYNAVGRIYLDEGIHSFELLSANTINTADKVTENWYDIAILFQGPDGTWNVFDTTNAFTIPEPVSISLLMLGGMTLLGRRRMPVA